MFWRLRFLLRPGKVEPRLLVGSGFKGRQCKGKAGAFRKLGGASFKMPLMPRSAVTRCRKRFPNARVPTRGTKSVVAPVNRDNFAGRTRMRYLLLTTCIGAALAGCSASGNEQLQKMSQNPKDWVMPTGNYANTRYSELKQITADNVGKLQAAWTFSTGVLRGHEGGPLIIGDVM